MGKEELARYGEVVRGIEQNISLVFIGKQDRIKILLLGLCCGLHVLIEDVPGVGKTTLARTLAASVGLDFGRIQFTPDLLPGDIVGMTVWSAEKRDFVYKQGAVMHQFVLADEINRASPRTQSSLLEAMQEGSVTVDGKTHRLAEPFFVLATQNPVHFLGAFPLPEGELDRFGLSLTLGYPNEREEVEILSRFKEQNPLDELKAVTDAGSIQRIRHLIREVAVTDRVKQYIVQIANETRLDRQFRLGLSPRASQHLMLAGQAAAFMAGRTFVIPEDIREITPNVLSHRLILSAETKLENISPVAAIAKIVDRIRIPTGLDER